MHSAIKEITVIDDNGRQVYLKVSAGVNWDDFVRYCVDHELYGAENLSYIPGEAGASAVQNVGAYGVEAKDIIDSVHTVDSSTGETRVFKAEECGYGYRNSIFKQAGYLKQTHRHRCRIPSFARKAFHTRLRTFERACRSQQQPYT